MFIARYSAETESIVIISPPVKRRPRFSIDRERHRLYREEEERLMRVPREDRWMMREVAHALR